MQWIAQIGILLSQFSAIIEPIFSDNFAAGLEVNGQVLNSGFIIMFIMSVIINKRVYVLENGHVAIKIHALFAFVVVQENVTEKDVLRREPPLPLALWVRPPPHHVERRGVSPQTAAPRWYSVA